MTEIEGQKTGIEKDKAMQFRHELSAMAWSINRQVYIDGQDPMALLEGVEQKIKELKGRYAK